MRWRAVDVHEFSRLQSTGLDLLRSGAMSQRDSLFGDRLEYGGLRKKSDVSCFLSSICNSSWSRLGVQGDVVHLI